MRDCTAIIDRFGATWKKQSFESHQAMEAHKERLNRLAKVADMERTLCIWSLVVCVPREQLKHFPRAKLAINSTVKLKGNARQLA